MLNINITIDTMKNSLDRSKNNIIVTMSSVPNGVDPSMNVNPIVLTEMAIAKDSADSINPKDVLSIVNSKINVLASAFAGLKSNVLEDQDVLTAIAASSPNEIFIDCLSDLRKREVEIEQFEKEYKDMVASYNKMVSAVSEKISGGTGIDVVMGADRIGSPIKMYSSAQAEETSAEGSGEGSTVASHPPEASSPASSAHVTTGSIATSGPVARPARPVPPVARPITDTDAVEIFGESGDDEDGEDDDEVVITSEVVRDAVANGISLQMGTCHECGQNILIPSNLIDGHRVFLCENHGDAE